ncbi:MAG: methylmalonyl-CoA mutase family protein [Chloroflexota bacterium]
MAVSKAVRGSKTSKNNFEATLSEWEEKVRQPSLASKPERKKEYKTLSDYVAKPIYTPLDLEGIDYQRDIGFPGQYPFTRGSMPNGYRSHDFAFSVSTGSGTCESCNKRIKSLIALGSKNASSYVDLPTQIALDSDDPRAKGEVGKIGTAIASLADAEGLLDGIDISKYNMGFGASNCVAFLHLPLMLAMAEKRGVKPEDLPSLRLQNDPFKEYSGRGTFIFPVPIAIELSTDVKEYLVHYIPQKHPERIRAGSVCTTQLSWCGIGAGKELGFALAHFATYIDSALRRGLKLEEFVPKMDWHAGCDLDIFQEAAKFRAGRRLFARMIKEKYHCDLPKVQALYCTCFISSQRMTAQQPFNNLCRISMEVLAAMLGGLENIAAPGYDEALAIMTEQSGRLSSLVKFILLHECGLENTIDPLAGSYYVESLTKQIEEEAQYWFQKIEDIGGAVAAVQKGFHHQEELKGVYKEAKLVASGERTVIGVNRFRLNEEPPVEIFQGDPKDEQRQIERLKKLRAERNNALVEEKLARLEDAAYKKVKDNKFNIIPAVLDAVKVYATHGEIGRVTRKVFGEYKAPTTI